MACAIATQRADLGTCWEETRAAVRAIEVPLVWGATSSNHLHRGPRPPATRPHLLGAGLIGCAVLGVWLIVASLSSRAPAAPTSFGFDDVYALARSLAAQPYRAPDEQLPPLLRYL